MKNSLQEIATHTASTWLTLIFEIGLVGVFFVVLRRVGVPKDASVLYSALFAMALGCFSFAFTYVIYPKMVERSQKSRDTASRRLLYRVTERPRVTERRQIFTMKDLQRFALISGLLACIVFFIITKNYWLMLALAIIVLPLMQEHNE